jgi:hypothetical protein
MRKPGFLCPEHCLSFVTLKLKLSQRWTAPPVPALPSYIVHTVECRFDITLGLHQSSPQLNSSLALPGVVLAPPQPAHTGSRQQHRPLQQQAVKVVRTTTRQGSEQNQCDNGMPSSGRLPVSNGPECSRVLGDAAVNIIVSTHENTYCQQLKLDTVDHRAGAGGCRRAQTLTCYCQQA